jgi:hypothetical protein
MQASLFDHDGQPQVNKPAALARRSDQPTSHQAAAEIAGKLGYCAANMLDAFRYLGEATASEAAQLAADAEVTEGRPTQAESYRKRAGELERAGRITVTGTRKCRVSGKQARTFRATTTG